MPTSSPKHLRRVCIATGVVALIAATLLSRGLAMAAPTSGTTPSGDVQMLNMRIAELERRIATLEAASAGRGGATIGTAPGPTTVRAPFIVLDANGKPLARIERSARTGFARLTVGDSVGSAAALVASSEGGALQLIDASDKVRVGALASKTKTGVFTYLRAGKTFMGTNDDGLPVFQALNLGDKAVAELKAMQAQDGQLVLTNEAGDRLVVAGVSTKGVGVVKTGPAGNGAAAVMGDIALPASEIQGKKK